MTVVIVSAVTIVQPEVRTAEWGVDPGKSNHCSRTFHRNIALPARPVLNSVSIILLALKHLMVSLKESHYIHIKKKSFNARDVKPCAVYPDVIVYIFFWFLKLVYLQYI